MENWKNNVSFVLVEPKEPGNIGSSARALKNMGFRRLELVNPPEVHTGEAQWMACHATDIIRKAKVHSSFSDALQDKGIVAGTSRRFGRRRGLFLPLSEGINKIRAAGAAGNKVAVLFGREDKGLNNEEIDECGFVITIPTDPAAPSLNLAHSVLLIAYELSRETYKAKSPKLLKQKEMATLYTHIRETLKLLEYIPRGNRDLEARIMSNLKHIFGRAGLTDWEMRMLRGICSQMEKKVQRE